MITIGRDSSNDIVLTDVSISRTHASIESMIKGRLLIHDTQSHNGTYLWRHKGWIRVRTVRLGPDDRIRFGDHEMSFSELSFAFGSAGKTSVSGSAKTGGKVISGHFRDKKVFEKPRRNPHTGTIEEDKNRSD
jgi:pSer/pThr/pTyr-binding forkhead associated (FHA) protein